MILVDGSSLLHRVLHTEQADLKDSRGNYTGGVHGFLNSLNTAALKHQLHHLFVVAWDLGVPLFRRNIYKEYKPGKEPIGDIDLSLKSEQNLLGKKEEEVPGDFLSKYVATRRQLHSQILPLSGCLSLQVTNCEADDIIAYVCCKLTNEDIVIYSTDNDLLQLLTDRIQFYNGRDFKTHTVDSIVNEYNLVKDCWRHHWLTIRAIAGDSSDGIPGFSMTWDTAKKYADQLIDLQYNKHYSLYDSLARLERPPGARTASYEALTHGQDMFLRNYSLMDLRHPIDNKLPIIEDIKLEIASAYIYDIDQDMLEELLHTMDLRMSKVFVGNIIDSNKNHDIKEYIRKLVS
jgi:5'-3' exonuclease